MILSQVIHNPITNSVEATWVDADGRQVKCHSYSDRQMAVLRSDLGADAAAYEALMQQVEAAQQPYPAPTPEQIAEAALRADRDAARSAAKADNVVQYLRDHTPAECADYVQANVTDLASARQMLKKFAIVLCVLAKQTLR